MYKKNNKNVYIFFQPKENRKISLTEVLSYVIALAGINILIKATSPSRFISSLAIVLYFVSRHVTPFLMKKYSATITLNEVILDNVESNSVHLPIYSIEEISKNANEVLLISGQYKGIKYSYWVNLEDQDKEIFSSIVLERKQQFFNSISTEVRDAINLEKNKIF